MATNVVNDLAPLYWRGLSAPCSRITYNFAHNLPEYAYPYINGVGHDWTGRGPLTVTATLHFLNTIEADLYPTRWEEWREALLDGEIDDLDHPELGIIRARVLTPGDITIDAESPAGPEPITITWIESLDDPTSETEFTLSAEGVAEAAEQADAAMAELGLEYPTGEPELSISEAIGSVQGQVFSLGLSVSGKINQVEGALLKIKQDHELVLNSVANANDAVKDAIAGKPAHMVFEANWDIVYETLQFLKDQAEKGAQPTKTYRTTAVTSLGALAGKLGNTVSQLVQLNPTAIAAPSVAPDTTITYFA